MHPRRAEVAPAGSTSEALWSQVPERLAEKLQALLDLPDEAGLDPRWARAQGQVREYVLRPSKRLRPLLLFAGYAVGRGSAQLSSGLLTFAGGLELLHSFLLVHDDVADRAEVRRGGPALHRLLGGGRLGEDLAVVVGDHLFARAFEAMFGAGLPGAAEAARYLLAVCRQTAAGQYLDLELSAAPLPDISLFQTLKVAHLKTGLYGFVAPLVCGATLGGASRETVRTLERVGRHAGVAFQLRDDLLGLFGDPTVSGKSGDGDFFEGKRTFPLMAAYARGDAARRARLEALWGMPNKDAAALEEARREVEQGGGRRATERAIARATRAALRGLQAVPPGSGRDFLRVYLNQLAQREA